jgi:hypothetical protein
MNTERAGLDEAVFMDSGFRRNDGLLPVAVCGDFRRRHRVCGGVGLGALLGRGLGRRLGVARRLKRILDVAAAVGGVAQYVRGFGRALIGRAFERGGVVVGGAILSAADEQQRNGKRQRDPLHRLGFLDGVGRDNVGGRQGLRRSNSPTGILTKVTFLPFLNLSA